MLPKAPETYIQERLGINAVATAAANLGQIWRELTTADVGVDGHLEFVDQNGFATGRTVAMQVKSGPSFFNDEDTSTYRFYPAEKHRSYWERYPIPVLLVLHNPDQNRSYWTDARQFLRSPDTSERAYIAVPKHNVLQTASVVQLFQSAGVIGDPFIPELDTVLVEMVNRRPFERSFPVSFFDLFTQGLTNLARSVYFGIDLAENAAEVNIALSGGEEGIGLGEPEHRFLFDYVKFLLSQTSPISILLTASSTGSTGKGIHIL